MEGYLGETPKRIEDSPYAGFTPIDWAIYVLEREGKTTEQTTRRTPSTASPEF